MSSTPAAALDLEELHDFTVALARKAGDNLLRAVMTRTGVQETVEKESSVDLVTQADEDAEKLIRTEVLEKYPDHKFIGEETYSKGSARHYLVDSSPTWVVDPLDGTVNFVHGWVMFCVSIGFLIDNEPVVGVIYAPFLNQLFSSRKGHGAYMHISNGNLVNQKLRLPLTRTPLPPNAPRGCILSCEWGKDRRASPEGNLHKKLQSFKTLALEPPAGGMVHGVRCLGSAAMDLAYLAMGGVDIWLEGGCWEWDVAAGVAILKEAGGMITTCDPNELNSGKDIPDAHLGGRLFLGIRAAADTENETAREAQERVVREVWKRIVPLDYTRPGLTVGES